MHWYILFLFFSLTRTDKQVLPLHVGQAKVWQRWDPKVVKSMHDLVFFFFFGRPVFRFVGHCESVRKWTYVPRGCASARMPVWRGYLFTLYIPTYLLGIILSFRLFFAFLFPTYPLLFLPHIPQHFQPDSEVSVSYRQKQNPLGRLKFKKWPLLRLTKEVIGSKIINFQ